MMRAALFPTKRPIEWVKVGDWVASRVGHKRWKVAAIEYDAELGDHVVTLEAVEKIDGTDFCNRTLNQLRRKWAWVPVGSQPTIKGKKR